VRRQSLFTVEPANEGVTPAVVDAAVHRALRVAGLLGLSGRVAA
jgi:hypothetical protein